MLQPTVVDHSPAQKLPLPRQLALPASSNQLLLVIFVIIVLTSILILYVLPNSQISEARAQIQTLKAERAALDRQIAEIDRQIAVETDLQKLKARAAALGMGPPKNAMFVAFPAAPKSTSRAAATTIRPETPPVATSQPAKISWNQRLDQAITDLRAWIAPDLGPAGGQR